MVRISQPDNVNKLRHEMQKKKQDDNNVEDVSKATEIRFRPFDMLLTYLVYQIGKDKVEKKGIYSVSNSSRCCFTIEISVD